MIIFIKYTLVFILQYDSCKKVWNPAHKIKKILKS